MGLQFLATTRFQKEGGTELNCTSLFFVAAPPPMPKAAKVPVAVGRLASLDGLGFHMPVFAGSRRAVRG